MVVDMEEAMKDPANVIETPPAAEYGEVDAALEGADTVVSGRSNVIFLND